MHLRYHMHCRKLNKNLCWVCGCLLCGVCVQPLTVGVVCGQRACKQACLYADNVVFEVGITKGYFGPVVNLDKGIELPANCPN